LPEKVIPVAGMCLGWPFEEGKITPRLSLAITIHAERFADDDLNAAIDAYDHRRAATRPYRVQREPERFGRENFYGWSEDKARQYAVPLLILGLSFGRRNFGLISDSLRLFEFGR
jgi:hypothetical protein